MSKDSASQDLTYWYIAKEIARKYVLFFCIAFTFVAVAGIYLGMQVVGKEGETVVVEKEGETVVEFGIKLIVEKTSQLSILMLGIAFFYLLLHALVVEIQWQKACQEKRETLNAESIEKVLRKSDFAGALTRLLIGSFGASTIPTGISLVLCAFNKEYITHLSGLEIYIAFAGITLISIAVLSIYEEKSRIKDEVIGNGDKNIDTLEKLTSILDKSN